MKINGQRGNAAIILLVVLGVGALALVIVFFIKAMQHSEEIYEEIIEEAIKEQNASKYGFGAIPDESLTDEEYEDKRKQKPIIYIYPTIRKKK